MVDNLQQPQNNPPSEVSSKPTGVFTPPVSEASIQQKDNILIPSKPNENIQETKGNIFRTILVIVTLLLLNPLGLILMFTVSRWKKWIKIVILIACVPLYIREAFILGNFIWRFKADRQISDTIEVCVLQCSDPSQNTELFNQCRNDCVKSKLDPNIYQFYQSEMKK